jgi:hypothetical protein
MVQEERPPEYSEVVPDAAEPILSTPSFRLDGIQELSILILGETGVGKLTFINGPSSFSLRAQTMS